MNIQKCVRNFDLLCKQNNLQITFTKDKSFLAKQHLKGVKAEEDYFEKIEIKKEEADKLIDKAKQVIPEFLHKFIPKFEVYSAKQLEQKLGKDSPIYKKLMKNRENNLSTIKEQVASIVAKKNIQ